MDGSQLKLKAQLDYERHQSHDLTITVSDSLPMHNVVITGTVNVGSVNEGLPVFSTGKLKSLFLFMCVLSCKRLLKVEHYT